MSINFVENDIIKKVAYAVFYAYTFELLFIIDFRFFILKIAFFVLKFVVITNFVSSSYDSIISSHVITKSSIILAKYFPFSQLHVAGFQI